MTQSAGSIESQFLLDITNFMNNLNEAQNAVANVSSSSQSNLQRMGDAFTTTGRQVTNNLTKPILGIAKASVSTATSFNAEMSKVEAISGATGEDLEKLRAIAEKMGATTKFSASQAAEGLVYMSMAGWDAQSQIAALPAVMDLAAASGEDLGTVSDIVTDSMTAFGLSAEDAAGFADVLATASSKSNTNVGLLGETFKYVAPVAGSLGFSVQDTAVSIGLMANAGIKGSQAGTTLRASLTRLVNPTGDGAKLMKEYGLSITNTDGSMKSLSQITEMLRGKLGGLDEATKAQVSSTLFGQEAMSGMLAIINASPQDYEKLKTSINGADGSAKDMADTMQNNLQGKLDSMKSAIEGVAIKIGDLLTPIVEKAVEWITTLAQKFGGLSPATQTAILAFGGLLAIIGPLVLIMGFFANAIVGINSFMALLSGSTALLAAKNALLSVWQGVVAAAQWALNLAMMANPIGLIIGLIVLLVGAFVLLWVKCEGFREFWIGLWEKCVEMFKKFVDSVKKFCEELGKKFSEFVESVKGFFTDLGNKIKEVWTTITSWITEKVTNIVNAVFEKFSGMGEFISGFFEGVKTFLTGVWEFIVNLFLGALGIILDIFTLNFDEMGEHIGLWISNMVNSLTDMFTGLSEMFTNWLNGIKEFWGTIWDEVKAKGEEIWNNITTYLSTKMEEIGKSISTAWTNFKNTITTKCTEIYNSVKEWFGNVLTWLWELPGKLLKIGIDMMTKMKDGLFSKMQSIYTTVTEGVGKAVDWIKDLPRQALTWGKDMVQGMIDGIKSMIGAVGDAAKSVADKIWSFLHFTVPEEGPLTSYEEWMPHFMQGMAKGLRGSSPELIGEVEKTARGISSAMEFGNQYGTESYGVALGKNIGGTSQGNSEDNRSATVTYNINIDKLNGDETDARRLAEELESFRRREVVYK